MRFDQVIKAFFGRETSVDREASCNADRLISLTAHNAVMADRVDSLAQRAESMVTELLQVRDDLRHGKGR